MASLLHESAEHQSCTTLAADCMSGRAPDQEGGVSSAVDPASAIDSATSPLEAVQHCVSSTVTSTSAVDSGAGGVVIEMGVCYQGVYSWYIYW